MKALWLSATNRRLEVLSFLRDTNIRIHAMKAHP